ncbi:OmpA family protein [Acetobacter sp. AN02]|uniref:OmpA family protein n=1 Tax=Acetobacter sp. AN02 TaxID=2894186 RepID=UPI0024341C7E|nr:OmpA family protein [Acetobacter sp. AN02]MDG6095074.1 OmpA family protein [Acetobacter sp. AN02]
MRLRFGFLSGTVLCSLSGLFAASVAHAQPVQGLYISGAGGASFNQDQRVRSSPMFPDGRDRWKTGVTGLGAVGWGLGNGFRVEVEGNYRNLGYKRLVSNSLPDNRGDGRRQTYGVMANAMFDMDVGSPYIFPYFGAGVGYGWTAMNTTITAPGNMLSQHVGGTYGAFTYQGIFGLSFPIPKAVGLSFTTEYRFWTMLGPQGHGSEAWGTIGGHNMPKEYSYATGNRNTITDFNHSLMVGLRYEFNPAPPPMPPEPPVTAVPTPAVDRSYIVFFDWDKTDLSSRARAIISEAARASTSAKTTHIEVQGYSDNSAAHPGARGKKYNQDLSVRRAQVVKAELVRDGVPGPAIDVVGFGEEHPLVPTGPNAREPQNRRVEIVMK